MVLGSSLSNYNKQLPIKELLQLCVHNHMCTRIFQRSSFIFRTPLGAVGWTYIVGSDLSSKQVRSLWLRNRINLSTSFLLVPLKYLKFCTFFISFQSNWGDLRPVFCFALCVMWFYVVCVLAPDEKKKNRHSVCMWESAYAATMKHLFELVCDSKSRHYLDLPPPALHLLVYQSNHLWTHWSFPPSLPTSPLLLSHAVYSQGLERGEPEWLRQPLIFILLVYLWKGEG